MITAVGLALRILLPPLMRWSSPHDDEALIRIADSILAGQWLGVWGEQEVPHITLAKGPGYPLFLAAINWTGLTPPIAGYILYLTGALLVATALRARIGRNGTVLLYTVLAFNPVVFSSPYSQVYRDQLVASAALLALGLGAHIGSLLARAPGKAEPVRVGGAALLLGAVLGLLAVTRGDTIWVVLGAVFAALALGLPGLRHGGRRTRVTAIAAGALVGVLTVAAPLTVALINEAEYGVRVTDDYSDGSFADALTLWSSVQVAGSDPLVPISREQRAAVYAVSPTARSVAEQLEKPDSVWIARNCSSHADKQLPCDELGAFLTWALRDAAVKSHEISDARAFQGFFTDLAEEIRDACDSGELTCGRPGLSPDVPPLDRISERAVIANLAGHINGALAYDTAGILQKMPPPDGDSLDAWRRAVNGTDTVIDLVRSGQHPTTIAQTSILTLLQTVYTWVTVPLLVLAVATTFLRRTWTTPEGRLGLVALGGWLTNLVVVSIFYAGANRTRGDTMPIYTMSSQSFLLLGVVLCGSIALRYLVPQGVRPQVVDRAVE